VQYLPLWSTVVDLINGRLQACPDIFKPPHLGVELRSRSADPACGLVQGTTVPQIHTTKLRGTISR
jgi:hypothetical protein